MSQQFPPSEFDDWAASYDEHTEAEDGYPFDGYARCLQTIVDQAAARPGDRVLDLGAGTGNLAVPFARLGCEVWCLDFSSEMLARARRKLPNARFALADIRAELPADFQRRYDHIVSAYTFHHFPLAENVALAQRYLKDHLKPGGALIIGDIAFQDAAEEDRLRQAMGDDWEQEYFWLADETLAAMSAAGVQCAYTRVSACAGVFRLSAQG